MQLLDGFFALTVPPRAMYHVTTPHATINERKSSKFHDTIKYITKVITLAEVSIYILLGTNCMLKSMSYISCGLVIYQ